MKKIAKLLPVALAFMLISPAFAATSPKATSDLEVTVPEFINITKVASVESSTASFDDSYTKITLTPALNSNFKVINNLPNRAVYLNGTVAIDGNTNAKALYGTDEQNMKLVFTNTTRLPDNDSVLNITGGSAAYASNPNAIAFAITSAENFAPDTSSGAKNPTITFNAQVAKYVISNGVYNPTYTLATTAEAQTFSTHDTQGLYKATLTLTTTQP